MNRLIKVILFCFFASLSASAQIGCVDSNWVNPYYPCKGCYKPVCGCDGKTYRNECAAENWGGLITRNYTEGVCDNFDFDFVPNPVNNVSTVGNCDYYMNIYVRPTLFPANTEVNLYNVYYAVPIFIRYMTINSNDNYGIGKGTPVPDLNNDYFSTLENGVYIVVVNVNGEAKSKKIVVVTQD